MIGTTQLECTQDAAEYMNGLAGEIAEQSERLRWLTDQVARNRVRTKELRAAMDRSREQLHLLQDELCSTESTQSLQGDLARRELRLQSEAIGRLRGDLGRGRAEVVQLAEGLEASLQLERD